MLQLRERILGESIMRSRNAPYPVRGEKLMILRVRESVIKDPRMTPRKHLHHTHGRGEAENRTKHGGVPRIFFIEQVRGVQPSRHIKENFPRRRHPRNGEEEVTPRIPRDLHDPTKRLILDGRGGGGREQRRNCQVRRILQPLGHIHNTPVIYTNLHDDKQTEPQQNLILVLEAFCSPRKESPNHPTVHAPVDLPAG